MADLLTLDVGAVAHGGHCVARHEGRVVFVRHALPGERVVARVTEDRGSYLRADAVEVLLPSPDRVQAPCPYAGPARCGGCDWQHARPEAQRALKRDVVIELFDRLAGLDVRELLPVVAELPGGPLGWRTRIDYAVAPDGTPGLRRHRSHDVEPVRRCLLGVPGVGDATLLDERWPGVTAVSAVRGDGPDVAVLTHAPGPGRQGRGRRPPDRLTHVAGPRRVTHKVGTHALTVTAGGFWQVHPHAASTYAAAVVELLGLRPGEAVVELYAGAGAITVPLAAAVGSTGRVLALESSRSAVQDARRNLHEFPWAEVRRARVGAASLAGLGADSDVIVLDPPRSGAGRELMTLLCGLGARAIAYVACDPAPLARDVAAARDAGWELAALRAYDAFPMTHHLECVALLRP